MNANLEFGGGRMLRGYVKSLSPTSAGFNSGDFNKYRNNPPNPGDMGILTMTYTRNSVPFDIKLGCRLVQVMGTAATLALNQGDLTNTDRKAIKKIMEVQVAEIGAEDDHVG
ncbi:MAG: hypothetical protein R3298_00220 [Gammaproteobacteria bacterium]|nr:hypothetical protein [Gammaproteobacteria bacterium]